MAFLTNIENTENKLLQKFHTLRQRLNTAKLWRSFYEQTSKELQHYTDKELNDLGLHRSNIPDLARQVADNKV